MCIRISIILIITFLQVVNSKVPNVENEYVFRFNHTINSIGEVYHLGLGLMAKSNSYIYLESQLTSDELTRQQNVYNKQAQKKKKLEDDYKRLIEALEKHYPDSYHLLKSTELAEINIRKIQLPKFIRKQLMSLRISHSSTMKMMNTTASRIAGHHKSRKIRNLFSELGVSDQILTRNSAVSPPEIGEVYKEFKGERILRNGRQVELKSPIRVELGASTSFFTSRIESDPKFLTDVRNKFQTIVANGPHKAEVDKLARELIGYKIDSGKKGVLIWNRDRAFEKERNMTEELMLKIIEREKTKLNTPVLVGPPVKKDWNTVKKMMENGEIIDLTNHWTRKVFQDDHYGYVNQLAFFDEAFKKGFIQNQVSMKSGVLDGAAIFSNLPTRQLVEVEAGKKISDSSEHKRISKLQRTLENYDIFETDHYLKERYVDNLSINGNCARNKLRTYFLKLQVVAP